MTMEIDLPYILRVSIAMAAFYIAYMLLFRKEKMFLFNRYYLITSMLASFLIPLITFSKQIEVPAIMTSVQQALNPASVPYPITLAASTPANLNSQLIIQLLFLSGFIFLFTVFITGHIKAWWIIHKASIKFINGYSVHVTNKNIPPFTYFNKLVIPSGILDNPNVQSVLCHEHIHAKGQHCIDLCIAEILFLFQWFNPFAWLMKNAVRDNLEFLTDDEVISLIDKQEYQLSMVSLASKNTFYTFPSLSNQSQLKKRIIMMKKDKTNRFHWIKSLAIIPILTILTATLSGRDIQIVYTASQIDEMAQTIDNNKIEGAELVFSQVEKVIETKNEAIEVTKPSAKNKNSISKTVELKEITIACDEDKADKTIKGNVKDKDGKSIPGVSVILKGTTKGTITDIEGNFTMKNIPNSIVLSFSMIGYEKKEVSVKTSSIETVMIIVKLEKSTSETVSENDIPSPENNTNEKFLNFVNLRHSGKLLYIVDDEKYTDSKIPNSLNPEDIESISVLKNSNATEMYGDEAKNGVIIITTKNKTNKSDKEYDESALNENSGDNNISLRVRKTANFTTDISHTGNNPVFIIDDDETFYGPSQLKDLDPNNIKSIDVLKDKTAIDLYGEIAKNGVIIIKTKNNSLSKQ